MSSFAEFLTGSLGRTQRGGTADPTSGPTDPTAPVDNRDLAILAMTHSSIFGPDKLLGTQFTDSQPLAVLPGSFLKLAQTGKTGIQASMARLCITHAHTATTLGIPMDKEFTTNSPFVSSLPAKELDAALLKAATDLNPVAASTQGATLDSITHFQTLATEPIGGILAVVRHWDPVTKSLHDPVIQLLAAPALPPLVSGALDPDTSQFGWPLSEIWDEPKLAGAHPPFSDLPDLACPLPHYGHDHWFY